MKYDHTVKYNGVWYPPFEEIPDATKKTYTRSDITTMRVDDLRHLATSVGVPDAEEMTGTELKQLLLEKFNL